MQVVIVEPKKKPVVQDIDSDQKSKQKIVGGSIQAIFPFDEPVALICNEEGKLLNLSLNRVLRDDEGNVYDIISGTFFVCAAPPDSDHFTGLTDQEIKTYMERFATPEMFLNVGGDLFVLPYL